MQPRASRQILDAIGLPCFDYFMMEVYHKFFEALRILGACSSSNVWYLYLRSVKVRSFHLVGTSLAVPVY